MINYVQDSNILEADVEALVNTVNTVGVMGKGIALQFKKQFPENFKQYAAACEHDQVKTGSMFVTSIPTQSIDHPNQKWIVNFPTKEHWKSKSKIEWIANGLKDLRHWLIQNKIKSIAIPPLGAGNGGLDWLAVKPLIEESLKDLSDIEIHVFEPSTRNFKSTVKPAEVNLTAARALLYQVVDRYWILGMECTLLEIHKLIWFLQRSIFRQHLKNPLKLEFQANRYGPFARDLRHLVNTMEENYLLADKALADCQTYDVIWTNLEKQSVVNTYIQTNLPEYLPVMEEVDQVISGFESPFGMELLSTVDWLIHIEGCQRDVQSIKEGIANWKGGREWGQRKLRLFNDEHLKIALDHLQAVYH